jgi:hypothetical protein
MRDMHESEILMVSGGDGIPLTAVRAGPPLAILPAPIVITIPTPPPSFPKVPYNPV